MKIDAISKSWLIAIITRRIGALEQTKENFLKSIGKMMVKNEKAYDDLGSDIIVALDNAKEEVKYIDIEVTTLNWLLKIIKR